MRRKHSTLFNTHFKSSFDYLHTVEHGEWSASRNPKHHARMSSHDISYKQSHLAATACHPEVPRVSVDPFRSILYNILLSAFPDSKNVTFMDADYLVVVNKTMILQHFLNFTYHASML